MNFTLITGASKGIGYEMALLFAKNGHNLLLVARNKNTLAELAHFVENTNKVHVYYNPLDLSHPGAAKKLYKWVQEKSVSVNYLVNNAGFYVKGAFSETSWDDEEKLVQIQCINHLQLIKLFLPEMLKRGNGGILNVGSTGSFVPGPYNAVYCAAKSFVLSFSEALAEEIKGSGVNVTTICPGGTKTDFQDFNNGKKSFFFPLMQASTVARVGYKTLMKGKRVVVPGLAYKIQIFLIRFIPRNIVTRFARLTVSK